MHRDIIGSCFSDKCTSGNNNDSEVAQLDSTRIFITRWLRHQLPCVRISYSCVVSPGLPFIASALGGNARAEPKSADQASTKPKVCTREASNHSATNLSHSLAASARKKRHLETNACCSATPQTPKKTAHRLSKNTRAVWQDSDSSFLEDWFGGLRRASVRL